MPIVGLVCGDHAEAVTPNHFGLGKCLYVHPRLARWVMGSDATRPTEGWSVTELLGCLRAKAIRATMDVLVDPRQFVAMEVGAAWHRHMGSNGTRWWGDIAGLRVSGEPDEVSSPFIGDHKHSYSSPPRSGVWSSHQIQVSMYNLLAQAEGLPPFEKGVIWYAGKWGQEGRECDLLSEDAICNYQIHDGWTVGDNIDVARHAGKNPRNYPVTGKSVQFGKKTMCDYCPVRRDCERLEQ